MPRSYLAGAGWVPVDPASAPQIMRAETRSGSTARVGPAFNSPGVLIPNRPVRYFIADKTGGSRDRGDR